MATIVLIDPLDTAWGRKSAMQQSRLSKANGPPAAVYQGRRGHRRIRKAAVEAP